MPNPEVPHDLAALRAVEEEFRSRVDHGTPEVAPALITLPTELEFAAMAAEREARHREEQERFQKEYNERRELEKIEKRKSRLKKAMAAAAVFMALKSGGVIDMTGDRLTDAEDVVASAVQVPSIDDYGLSGEIDGIAFEDYSADAQKEMTSEAQDDIESIQRSRDTVMELFETVDRDGYESIIREVAEQRSAHPELFMPSEQIEEVRSSIESASTNEDVIRALDQFMKQYGIDASFDDGIAFDDHGGSVKDIAKSFVNVLSPLPKDFVAMSELEHVTVTNKPPSRGTETGGTVAGYYGEDSNQITIVALPSVNMAIQESMGFLAQEDQSYDAIVSHELGHAFNHNISHGLSLEDGESDDSQVMDGIEHLLRGIAKRPEAPSMYAMSDSEEYAAELKSGVLSDRHNGLASTNEWRRFGSESNKAMIATLVDLEQAYPGIAKILIADRA